MLLLYVSISKLYRKLEHMKTSVGVVKKHRCHQKRYGGMGCPVVQQACSEVCTSLKYQSDLQLSVAELYR